MLNLIPRHTPPLSVLMDDLRLTPASMARILQVSERSVYRWMSKDHAPRPVMLSLFFVSRWGVGTICAETENAARMWAGFARCLIEARGAGSMRLNIETAAANRDQWTRFSPRLVSA